MNSKELPFLKTDNLIQAVMILLTQIAFEIGIEDYIELLENHLITVCETQGEEAVIKLRNIYLRHSS